jgi:hypothetical protein
MMIKIHSFNFQEYHHHFSLLTVESLYLSVNLSEFMLDEANEEESSIPTPNTVNTLNNLSILNTGTA